jgi:hypothetical protein
MMNLIKSDLSDKQTNVDSIKPMLKEAGIEQEFQLVFDCEGFASRVWTAATTDADRQQRNLDLSQRRAGNVVAMLGDTFGPQHQYNATGKGSGLVLSGGPFGEAIPESDPALVDAKVKQREERIRARNQGEFTDQQIEEMLKEYRASTLLANRPNSDVPLARRVNITVTWSGYNIQFAAGAAGAQTPRQ